MTRCWPLKTPFWTRSTRAMHELSVCQDLLSQVQRIALERKARVVERIRVAAGPLSGVEPALLRQAFSIARSGTLAASAELEIESGPVVVRCRDCQTDSQVPSNRLLCGDCGTWQVDVIQGEDLVLMSIDLAGLPEGTTNDGQQENQHHV